MPPKRRAVELVEPALPIEPALLIEPTLPVEPIEPTKALGTLLLCSLLKLPSSAITKYSHTDDESSKSFTTLPGSDTFTAASSSASPASTATTTHASHSILTPNDSDGSTFAQARAGEDIVNVFIANYDWHENVKPGADGWKYIPDPAVTRAQVLGFGEGTEKPIPTIVWLEGTLGEFLNLHEATQFKGQGKPYYSIRADLTTESQDSIKRWFVTGPFGRLTNRKNRTSVSKDHGFQTKVEPNMQFKVFCESMRNPARPNASSFLPERSRYDAFPNCDDFRPEEPDALESSTVTSWPSLEPSFLRRGDRVLIGVYVRTYGSPDSKCGYTFELASVGLLERAPKDIETSDDEEENGDDGRWSVKPSPGKKQKLFR